VVLEVVGVQLDDPGQQVVAVQVVAARAAAELMSAISPSRIRTEPRGISSRPMMRALLRIVSRFIAILRCRPRASARG
jgi:hypothetical protein